MTLDPLAKSAARLFGTGVDKAVLRAAEAGVFPQALSASVTAAGFTALLPEQLILPRIAAGDARSGSG